MAYSNSPLVTHTRLSPNHSGLRIYPLTRITLHATAGRASVEGLGEIFARTERQASSNYGIGDDGRVGLYVEEKNRSWCSSSYDNDERSITCECSSDATEPFAMNATVYARIIDLCTDICQRYGKKRLLWIPDKDTALAYKVNDDELILTCHFWFTSLKSCPGTWLLSRLGDVAEQVTTRLNPAKPSTPAEPSTPSAPSTLSTVVEAMPAASEGWEEDDGNTPSTWAKESVAWAIEKGILLGDGKSYRLHDPVTREEMLTFLHRALSR